MKKLKFKLISPNKVIEQEVDEVSLPSVQGQITILPNHEPLLVELDFGELITKNQNKKTYFAISTGFANISKDNEITVVVDLAASEREISEEKAKQAILDAKKTIKDNKDISKEESIMIEASMRLAMIELKLARKLKKKI